MKLSSAVSEIGNRFGERRLLMGLVALYALIWVWAAWSPAYRFDWFLENLLPALMTLVLIFSFRKLPLSDISFALLFIFLVLHELGAHYQYSYVPLGFWLQEWLGLARNHFDRWCISASASCCSTRCAKSSSAL